jgi:predicted PurR-regulated permease PerM
MSLIDPKRTLAARFLQMDTSHQPAPAVTSDMSFARPIVFWIAMLAAFVAVLVLLRGVLLPFIAGMVLAYLLNPLVSKIERLGLSRLLATLAVVIPVVVAIIVLLMLTIPIIGRELYQLIDSLPLYARRLHTLTSSSTRPWVSKIIGEGLGEAERSIGALTAQASEWFDTFLRSIWSGGRALISMFSLAVVTPIIACYLLYHWNAMIVAIDHSVPPVRRDTVRSLAREIDDTIGGFVRGQSVVCLILAVFYAGALHLIGLEHGALIGFAAGVIGFIPYLGSLLGIVVSTGIAIAQFWPDWTVIWLVPAIFLIGQSLGDYVLAPYLVSRRVHLNPVWVIFALYVFGYLFGFAGLMIAVPLAAAIGVLVRFALRQYYASPLYATSLPACPPDTPSEGGEPDT